MLDKIKHISILLVLPTKLVFKHKKNMPYRTLAWGSYARGAPGQLPSMPMRYLRRH